MEKYFRTDGIRRHASDVLTLDIAVRIGQYLGWRYGENCHTKILIGRDTWFSSDMLEMDLAVDITSCGASVYLLGVCPTPTASYLIQREHFGYGVMVSASHGPFRDNGIKLFNGDGYRTNPEIKTEVEECVNNEVSVEVAHNEKIGSVIEWGGGLELYEPWLEEIVPMDLSGTDILLDLVNGSATSRAAETLSGLGAAAEVIHSAPGGINTGTECGSTHPEELQSMVKEDSYHIDSVFDGDTDHLIAVDEDEDLIGGNHTMCTRGYCMYDKGILYDNVVVTTVMSNLGLYHTLKAKGLKYEQAAVGDKYVSKYMRKHDYSTGGGQSGHIISRAHANTGDGLLTAMKLPEIMVDTKKSLKELYTGLFICPQLLISMPVHDKHAALEDEELFAAVDVIAQELDDKGRILIRPNGTESLVHIMVEAKTDALYTKYVNRTMGFIKEKGL